MGGVASHGPSGRRRLLHGDEPCLVLRRVEEQNSLWQQRWQQQQSLLRRRQEQALLCRTAEEFQSLADDRQQELEALWQGLLTLSAGLSADLPIPDWQVLLDQEPFTLACPVMPHPRPFPPEPVSSDPRYQPELSRMDKLFKRGQEKKQEEALAAFHLDYENWQHNRHHIEQQLQRLNPILGKDHLITFPGQQTSRDLAHGQGIVHDHDGGQPGWREIDGRRCLG